MVISDVMRSLIWLSAAALMSAYVPLPEGRLWFDERGKGPVVVLIHGGNMDSRMWDDQMAPFARSFRTIRYDVRPYGRSSTPTRLSYAHEDLRALLDHLKIDRAHLVGLSLGGRIAIDFALAYPERVDRLVLAGPGLSGFQFSPDDRLAPMLDAAKKGDCARAMDLWLQHPYMASCDQSARRRARRGARHPRRA